MKKVIIRAAGQSWLVSDELGNPIATVAAAWHFISLARVKRWDIVNRTALNKEIANKLP